MPTLMLLFACSEPPPPEPVINLAPTAECAVQEFVDGRLVLNAEESLDPEGEVLAYRWTVEAPGDFDAGFSEGFVPESTVDVWPVALGTYVFGVEATDGRNISDPVYCVWNLDDPEHTPVADAGEDQVIGLGEEVCFDGAGSYDPGGKALSYAWTLIDAPQESTLAVEDSSSQLCITPDLGGVFSVGLTVHNGQVGSATAIAHVHVQTENTGPLASAGADVTAQDCTWLSMDGSGSSDPDGDALDYFWEIQSAPAGSAVDSDASFAPDRFAESPEFFADVAGEYVLSLAVSDGQGWSNLDTVTVTLGERSFNSPPVVSAMSPPLLDAGVACCEKLSFNQYSCDSCSLEVTTLHELVTVNDPDNDPVSFLWESDTSQTWSGQPDLLYTEHYFESRPDSDATCATESHEMFLTVQDCTGATTTVRLEQDVQCCGDVQNSC